MVATAALATTAAPMRPSMTARRARLLKVLVIVVPFSFATR
jgi:hypothetical protein